MLCALIMAGGKGTRFWPLSTEEKPKQFLNLLGSRTMIQMTIDRIRSIIPMENIFICTVSAYVGLVKEQVPEIPEENIIIEPEGRNTAPCIILSSIIINRKFKDAVMVVLPSDHLIKNNDEFRNIILNCNEFLKKNRNALITIGMKPDRSETGYGYIKYDEKPEQIINKSFLKVKRFIEKPELKKAESYLRDGNYLWNGGIFLWRISGILNETREYCPEIYEELKNIKNVNQNELDMAVKDKYLKVKSISIDYAVLEKSKEIYVVPAAIGWDDIGTWKSIERYKKKDVYNNITNSNTLIIESKSNITINNEKKVIMIGINDVLTIETEDCFYIINKDYMDNLKEYRNEI
ncbi:mannose-1-phosphate guanylyltransferase [uncultured Clostridium sp.]|uniref:mannose-1-phosphate guanylyltransferase n=1 Tax=uncultured Clostridium sp. TaxID=59620 RepID=UPI0025D452F0|nr:sugar phosphate nucleotidyltransferase [uncultured Clostridium sp.]